MSRNLPPRGSGIARATKEASGDSRPMSSVMKTTDTTSLVDKIDVDIKQVEKDLHRTERKITPINANPLAIPSVFNLTDLGNAERLIELYGMDIRYCHPTATWRVWDGRRWAQDKTGDVYRFASETVRRIYHSAGSVENPEKRRELASHALRSESDARIKAMVNLATCQKGVPVIPGDMDADPWALNVLNGTIDLRAGILRPHRREDMISKISPVEYDPDARCAVFDEFLRVTTDGDKRLTEFLQRAIGYSLAGDSREEKLFFIYGPAASGKTTFCEAIKAALGDYALTADFSTFLKRGDTGGPRSDIARLAGSRIVFSQETDEGARLAEGLVKIYVGGDTMVARHLYKSEQEFKSRGKLWLVSNHAPTASDSDEALWRRIVVLPFEHVVPEENRDTDLKAVLTETKHASPGILAWAVRGCIKWQAGGLKVPGCVKQATQRYRKEINPIGEFIEDRCNLGPLFSCSSSALWEKYQRWANENGIRYPVKGRRFATHLKSYGLEAVRVGHDNIRVWNGIDLKTEARPDATG